MISLYVCISMMLLVNNIKISTRLYKRGGLFYSIIEYGDKVWNFIWNPLVIYLYWQPRKC